MCKILGLINLDVSLSIQHLINSVESHLLNSDGSISEVEIAAMCLCEVGSVLESDVPLTYQLGVPNGISERDVFKIKVDDVKIHNVTSYGSYREFLKKLLSLLNKAPIAVAVPNCKSFKDFKDTTKGNGNALFCPDDHQWSHEVALKPDFHVMVLDGSSVLNGIKFLEYQDSEGEHMGDGGYLKLGLEFKLLSHFVEIINPHRSFERFTLEKVIGPNPLDNLLYKVDIMVTKVHASMLAQNGLLTLDDKNMIFKGLDHIKKQIITNSFELMFDKEVHMHMEEELTKLIGEIAMRFHMTRNRKEQVAMDFRLWIRAAIDIVIEKIKQLQRALVRIAGKNMSLMAPRYSILGMAQPALLPDVLFTYVEQLERDVGRYVDCRKRLNVCPLGASALVTGTGSPIDRSMTPSALGFSEPMRNRIDAVSDQDFVFKLLSQNSITAIHLSQLGEEWALWASEEFGFMIARDTVLTEKLLKLVRGDFSRVIGDLVTGLSMSKGILIAPNRDFQQYREPLVASDELIMGMVDVVADFSNNVTFSEDKIKRMFPYGQQFSEAHKMEVLWQLRVWVEKLKMVELSLYN